MVGNGGFALHHIYHAASESQYGNDLVPVCLTIFCKLDDVNKTKMCIIREYFRTKSDNFDNNHTP